MLSATQVHYQLIVEDETNYKIQFLSQIFILMQSQISLSSLNHFLVFNLILRDRKKHDFTTSKQIKEFFCCQSSSLHILVGSHDPLL